MNLSKQFSKLSADKKRIMAIRTIGWGLPVALIPALRYVQDKDKKPELRKELFRRDFNAYSIGTGMYFGALAVAKKVMNSPSVKKLSQNKKILLPEVVATSSFCLWSGVFAPKVSKKFIKSAPIVENKIKEQPVEKQDINFSRRLQTPYSNRVYSSFKI